MLRTLESTVVTSLTGKVRLVSSSSIIRACSLTVIPALTGELRHIQKLRFWPLGDVLHDKYLLPKDVSDMIASFLNPMLRLVPEKRAKASELIHHAWLEGIVVQGEIDVIRRAEEEDARRRESVPTRPVPISAVQAATKHLQQEEANEADAMKPVDDLALADDVPRIAAPVPHTSSGGGKENASGSRGAPKLSSAPHGKPS